MAITSITGTNCWTKAEDLMIETLTACQSVLDFLGVVDVAAARAGNMYVDSLGRAPEEFPDAAWKAMFPNIIIGSPGNEADVFTLTRRSTGPDFGATGVLEVVFATQLDESLPDSESDQERAFKNAVGDILEELTQQDVLAQSEIAVQQYGRNPEEDHDRVGVVQACWTQVRWGTPVAEE